MMQQLHGDILKGKRKQQVHKLDNSNPLPRTESTQCLAVTELGRQSERGEICIHMVSAGTAETDNIVKLLYTHKN